MSDEKTPTSQRTLPVELSIAVFDRLDSIEVMSRTAANNSAQVLTISKELRAMFEELRDRYNSLETRVNELEGQRSTLAS